MRSKFATLLALVLLLSVFTYASWLFPKWSAGKQSEEQTDLSQTETTAPSDTSTKPIETTATESVKTEITISETQDNRLTKIDFKSLQEENPDTVGWIEIPGTVINYPIVKSVDNDYYLNRDFYGNDSKSGSIFMDYRNGGDFTNRHSILYGHHMRDGSMFAGLMAYKDSSFAAQNDIIFIDLPEGRTIWQIFAAYVTASDFYYIITDFPDESSFLSFLKTVEGKSSFQSEIRPNASDHLLTLSTCTYEYDDARFVVHAVRIDN